LHQPLASAWISNGGIKLGSDKRAIFGEIFRLLQPGGRLRSADIAKPVPEAAIRNIDLWTA